MVKTATYVCKTECRVNMLDDAGKYSESGRVPVGTRGQYVSILKKGMVTLKLDCGLLVELNVDSFQDKWRCES